LGRKRERTPSRSTTREILLAPKTERTKRLQKPSPRIESRLPPQKRKVRDAYQKQQKCKHGGSQTEVTKLVTIRSEKIVSSHGRCEQSRRVNEETLKPQNVIRADDEPKRSLPSLDNTVNRVGGGGETKQWLERVYRIRQEPTNPKTYYAETPVSQTAVPRPKKLQGIEDDHHA